MRGSLSRLTEGESHKWWALGTVAIGIFMASLDGSIVNIGLPTIMRFFRTDLPTIEWVVMAYLFTISVLLLPFGRLADMVGRKRVYTAGFIVFTSGSALCGAAQSPWQLILFRVLQAIGASMLMANGMAITTAVFPSRERGKALGINATIVATGATVGPTLGGLLIGWLGWRSIFYVNVPVGVIGTVMALLMLSEERISVLSGRPRLAFDLLGALTVAVSVLALLVALTNSQDSGWGSPSVSFLLVMFFVFLVAFLVIERHVQHPMVDLSLFRSRFFAAGNAAACLSYLAISANMFLMPFFLQLVLGYTPVQAGVLLTPVSLVIAVVAPLSGWLSDRLGARLLSSLGLAINCLALFSLSQLSISSGYGDVLARLTLLGLGQGMFQSPNNSAVMGSVPRERYGLASGFLSMMRNLGMVGGVAVSGTILASGMSSIVGHATLHDLPAATGQGGNALLLTAFMRGFQLAYSAAAAIAAIGIAASLVRGRRVQEAAKAPSDESLALLSRRDE
ncbi:MAG: MFS transporter [Chloroflexi bacterium]|nr:MFS transporter [Chloroflexota bacterium]MCL5074856.1 MFS transporter [Chloroflexota bacterium]